MVKVTQARHRHVYASHIPPSEGREASSCGTESTTEDSGSSNRPKATQSAHGGGAVGTETPRALEWWGESWGKEESLHTQKPLHGRWGKYILNPIL